MRRLGTPVALATVTAMLVPSVALAQDTGEDPGSEAFSQESYAQWLSTDPDDETVEDVEQGPFAGLLDQLEDLVAVAADEASRAAFSIVEPVHVTVLGTGVDTTVLGDRAGDVAVSGRGGADGTDALGWGTWATSVLLQSAEGVTIDLVDVYPGDRLHEGAVAGALAAIDPTTTDAVLLAFPPGDLLDPSLRLLASGRANDFHDAALETIVTREDGSRVVGIPMDAEARAAAEYVGGWKAKRDVRTAAGMIERWERSVDAIAALADAGVPVVSPAGDVGPGPQTVLGLAGLSDVITVGAADATGAVVPTSARGPSVHGTAKPDVVAPVVFAGVLPDGAAIADRLASVGLVDDALDVVLDGAVGATRTASASTISSAAGITAAVAGLAAAGADLPRVRGALMAAATPTTERDVLAEGAGVLATVPGVELLDRPLVSGPLDLGMEPDDPTTGWSAAVSVLGGTSQPPAVELDRWVGTGLDARRLDAVVAVADQPVLHSLVVGAGVSSDGEALTLRDGRIEVSATPGDNRWEPGVFCGYSRVDLIGTSTSVDSQVGIGTGPVVVPEDVPTCLVEGMELEVLNFYIHNLPARDFTMTLLPNLPVGMDVIEGPTMVLPVHPTKEKLYSKVSGEDGYTTFGAVLPGFYRMRQFSDYSIDVVEGRPGGQLQRNLGDPLTYSTKDALILPDVVCDVPREARGPQPDPCHVDLLDDLDAAAGDGEVGYDKTTGRYLVDLPGIGEQPVVLGWAKKMQLSVVSSRYVDAMGGGDWTTDSPNRTAQQVVELLADLSQVDELRDVAGPLAAAADEVANDATGGAAALLGLTDHWTWSASPEPGEPLLGTYAGFSTSGDPTTVMGMADYPFSLTTPNYKGSIDWNFTYELDEVALIAIVEVGRERHVALFTPAGVVSLSPITTEQPLDPIGLLEVQAANGVAHLHYQTHPRGAPSGLITLLALPLDPMEPARLELGTMSMEVTTWQRVEWPPTKHDRDGVEIGGHSFRLQPRWNDRQMSDKCHEVSASLTGGWAGRVCDEWDLFVHSGRYDIETFRILDTVDGADVTGELRPAGSLFHDPMRGVTDATLTVAHRATVDGLVDVDQAVSRQLRSNGEFFEVLHIPDAVVRQHGTELEVQQADNIVGRLADTITTHRIGAVPLTGYLPFVASHVEADGVSLLADGSGADVPVVLGATSSAMARIASSLPGVRRSTRAVTTSDEATPPTPPAPPAEVSELEAVMLDELDAHRVGASLQTLARTWDAFDVARDAASQHAADGTSAPRSTTAAALCCSVGTLQVVASADVPNWDTAGTVTATRLAEAVTGSSAADDLASPDADHVGVGVVVGTDGRMYAVVLQRDWDGTDVGEPPVEDAPDVEGDPAGGEVASTPPPSGGGGGGGGFAPAPQPEPEVVESPAPDVDASDGEGADPTTDSASATTGATGTGTGDGAAEADDRSTVQVEHEHHDPDARPVAELAYLCDLTRLSGPNREATAAAVSSAVFQQADTVVLASSGGFADALTGAPLAAALQAPILLTPSDRLDAAVVGELERLAPSTVVLLGGPKALAPAVEAEVRDRFGVEVVRLAGTSRWATSAAIASAVTAIEPSTHAYVVEGAGAWPDAVSVAGVAGFRGSPVLLTQRDRLPTETALWLLRSSVDHVTVVGGPGVVTPGVEAQLRGLGILVDRLAGTNRYATSAAVAQHAIDMGMSPAGVFLATGRNFPDALAAGPAAAAIGVPLLLVDGQDIAGSPDARVWLEGLADTLTCGVAIGGPRVVTDAVVGWAHALA